MKSLGPLSFDELLRTAASSAAGRRSELISTLATLSGWAPPRLLRSPRWDRRFIMRAKDTRLKSQLLMRDGRYGGIEIRPAEVVAHRPGITSRSAASR